MMLMTAKQAARELGVSDSRVRQLVLAGRLKASRHGRALAIDPDDLYTVWTRKAGRPKSTGEVSRGK
jgi:excisionase family DNA binding protein